MSDRLQADLLVIGGGMTGLTAAAVAARRGLDVLLVEKAPELGGSAALSSGYIWTAPTLAALQWEDPSCDAALGNALATHFTEGMDWVRSLGVESSERIDGIYGFGHGYQVDIGKYLARCRSALEAAGGWISTGVQVLSLVERQGVITGAIARDRDGEALAIDAASTLVATGSFQGDAGLRREHIGAAGERLLLRSNPYSTGDGLILGSSVGARITGGDGFYGHLIASPVRTFEPKDYLNYAQLHSGYCLLLNKHGRRFTDESLGDHVNNQRTLRQPASRAIIVGDEHVRQTHVLSAYIPGMDILDKLEFAAIGGANYCTADTVEALAVEAGQWGYDREAVARTVNEYNAAAPADPESLQPPSSRYRRALDAPPYFALEVQPAITFGYAGLATDPDGRVLGAGGPIPGLLAGGVDVGGVYRQGYAGALSRGLVSGLRAALTAAGEPSWSPPVPMQSGR